MDTDDARPYAEAVSTLITDADALASCTLRRLELRGLQGRELSDATRESLTEAAGPRAHPGPGARARAARAPRPRAPVGCVAVSGVVARSGRAGPPRPPPGSGRASGAHSGGRSPSQRRCAPTHESWFLRDRLQQVQAEGWRLAAANFPGYPDSQEDPRTCSFAASAEPIPGRDLADTWYEALLADGLGMEVEPPSRVVLPAGPGWTLAMTWGGPDTPSWRGSMVQYVVAGDKTTLWVSCVAFERPDDDWLPIVETLEFLPAEE